MSDLKEQNYGFGAGLTALFDYNLGILPSFIEDVTESDLNGKRTRVTKGKFFKVKTPEKNEFIIYIKYSNKLIANENMVSGFMWQFSLSEIEKRKIESQYQNTGTFFILLVCIKNESVSKLSDQIALLTWEDYCEIRHRTNIQLGIWKNPNAKKQGAKAYYLRKGKGQKEEYFLKIKRNLIEKKLDEIRFETGESEERNFQHNNGISEIHPTTQYVEMEPETLSGAENNLYIKDNVTWCGRCKCKNKEYTFTYSVVDSKGHTKVETLYTYQCPTCKQNYITPRIYEDNVNRRAYKKINLVIQRIKTLVDKVYLTPNNGCVYCDNKLSASACRLKLYKNLKETNVIELIVEEDLFYCKNCGIYFASPLGAEKLMKKYGHNKIKFVDDNNKQQRLVLY